MNSTNQQGFPNESHLISYQMLRRSIGILGIGLPWACLLANITVNGLDLLNNPRLTILGPICRYNAEGNLKASISMFYYTAAAPLFIGILVTFAVFFFAYLGDKPQPGDRWPWLTDRLLANLSAVFALGIVVFPAGADCYVPDSLFIFTVTPLVGWIHNIFAGLFFLMMALFCLVNFRRKGREGDEHGPTKDKLFQWCGWTILVTMALIIVEVTILEKFISIPYLVFFLEALALAVFGVAWLAKGRVEEVMGIG